MNFCNGSSLNLNYPKEAYLQKEWVNGRTCVSLVAHFNLEDSDDCDTIFEVHYVGEDVLLYVEVQLKLLKCGYFLNPRLGIYDTYHRAWGDFSDISCLINAAELPKNLKSKAWG
jgi:hypothetical protein